MRRAGVASAAAVAVLLLCAPPAHADIIRGLTKILTGVLTLPVSIITGTFSGPPVLGTVLGVVNGAVGGVTMVASGLLDLAASAVPIAKAVAPFLIPVFL